jgi:hypothetical protein
LPWRTFIPALVVAAAFLQPITAQAPPAPRITQAVTDRQMVRLQGNTNPLARPAADRGAAAPGLALDHMLLVLRRSGRQQAELQQLLDELRENDAPQYHQWLTPQEFGTRFGPAPADVATLTAWLAGEGFHVDQVAAGGGTIEFSGTAANVAAAFHTEMHRYQVNGVSHLANASDPSIPAALAPVVAGVVSLNDFQSHPNSHIIGQGHFVAGPAGEAQPSLNYTDQNGAVQHVLVPGDLGKIYDLGVNPSTGSGQTIALVARSDVSTIDVDEFRNLFSTGTEGQFQTISVGVDPGLASGNQVGDYHEATLDAEWANALAPSANVDLVVAASTDTTDGVVLAAQYIVDHDLAPVMSTSFGECEALEGAAENTFWLNLWEQAAAEGITALVSSGDDGASGCDDQSSGKAASQGLAVSGVASTPYDTAVGGTEFNESSVPGTYWSATNGTNFVTALGYIPEEVWNESSAASGNISLWAGSGGKSVVYSKPPWQAGAGVPADSARDLPDVALTAAGHDGYVVCMNHSCNEVNGGFGFGVDAGTSAASPSWAGIMALVDQQQGGPVGLANPVLYKLAAAAGVFHDVTTGSNAVPCAAGTPDCGPSGTLGYSAAPGFDLATGWGSPDIANLLQQWGAVKFAASTTTLQLTLPQNLTYGQRVPVAIQVTAANGGPTPTGNVVLLAQEPDGGEAPIEVFPLGANGAVNASTAGLPAGTHNVAARYSGDLNYGTSTSAPVMVTASKADATVSVQILAVDAEGKTTPVTQAIFGETVAAEVTVSGPAAALATGNVSMSAANGSSLPFTDAQEPLDHTGNAYFLVQPGTAAGSYSFTASYAGDSNVNAASAPFTLAVNKAPTSVQILSFTNVLAYATLAVPELAIKLEAIGSYRAKNLNLSAQVYSGTTPLGTVYFSNPVLDPVTQNAEFDGDFGLQQPLPGAATTLSVQFAGSADYLASTSPPFSAPTPPNLVFSPSSIDFGAIPAGSSSKQSVTLSNQGGMAAILHFYLDGDGFTESDDCGGTLAPAASCTIAVAYESASNPNFSFSFAGSLGTGQLGSQVLNLWGSISGFTPESLNNAVQLGVGEPAVFSLSLRSENGFTGIVALACSDLPVFTNCSISPASVSVNPAAEGSATVTITEVPPPASSRFPFRPWPVTWILWVLAGWCVLVWVRSVRVPALLMGVLILAACGGAGGVIGSGGSSLPPVGTPPLVATPSSGAPKVQFSVANVNFGRVQTGSAAATQLVQLSNRGTSALTIAGVALAGPNAGDFSLSSNCSGSLAVNVACLLNLGFRPTTGSAESASVIVTDSGSDSPQQIPLLGTGVDNQLVPGTYNFIVTASAGTQIVPIHLNLTVQ